jgi:hypothetical protein
MAYDEVLASRIRDVLATRADVAEKKMFGGLVFMVSGRMACGVLGRDMIVKVGSDRYTASMAEAHTRVMDFTGRPSRGMVYVSPEGTATDAELQRWVGIAVSVAEAPSTG